MLRQIGLGLTACACLFLSTPSRAQESFFDDFETGLSQWTGKWGGPHTGTIVDDPIRPGNKVLSFTATNSGGDIFGTDVTVLPGDTHILSFEYLGLPGMGGVPDNLGGTIGIAEDTPERHRWLAGTSTLPGSCIEDDPLVDDGQWRSYSIVFDVFVSAPGQCHFFTTVPPSNDTIRLMVEDYLDIAGDVFFDNVRLERMAAPPPSGTVWYVDVVNCDGGTGGSGTQADPFCLVQDAIDAAADGDTILVRPGNYFERIDLLGKELLLRSDRDGVPRTYDLDPRTTILDGGRGGSVVVCRSGEGPNTILDGLTITAGYAPHGGGMFIDGSSSPTVVNCTFSENSADYRGGGMYCDGGSSPTVRNCVFSENSAGDFGGGMFDDGFSNSTMVGCTFSQNSAGIRGGGMYDGYESTVLNCIFYGNFAGEHGGGLSNNQSTVINSTFFGNTAGLGGGGMYVHGAVSNCILWGDVPNEIYQLSTVTIANSCVQGGYPGRGNVDVDPLFADSAGGDFHLTFASPCRDSGDNSVVTERRDFEDDPRISHGTVDIGADEFHPHLYVTGQMTPGGSIQIKFVGYPGTAPVGLLVGSGVLPSPMSTKWGVLWLQSPLRLFRALGRIPAEGILVLPRTVPNSPESYDMPMQAVIGLYANAMTNLYVMQVR